MKKLIQGMSYAAMRLVGFFVQVLPERRAYRAVGWVGRFVAWMDPRHGSIALGNLERAFPHQSREALRRLVPQVYVHFARLYVDLLFFRRRVRAHNWKRWFEWDNKEVLDEAWKRQRKLIVVSGHLGNWEVGIVLLSLLGYPITMVARRQENSFLDPFMRSFRTHRGARVLDKEEALREMIRDLRQERMIGMAIDQDARHHGLFVPFFGHPASTIFTPALLAYRLSIPLVVSRCYRVGEAFRFRIGFEEVRGEDDKIKGAGPAHRQDHLEAITAKINAILEDYIRRTPEQYLWLHRRWKTQPPPLAK